MNHGFKVVPFRMRKNTEAIGETWKKRVVAFNKNMLLRHRSHRTNRFRH